MTEAVIDDAYKLTNRNPKGTNREKIALMQDSNEAQRELHKHLKMALASNTKITRE